MVNTRSSLSPSGSSKLLLDKLKMKKTISEDDNEDLSGGSEGSGDVSVKEVKKKKYNRGNKKVTDDRPLKKLKQVVEYDEDFYDSDDLEVENNESMKFFFFVIQVYLGVNNNEWELYFKHEDRVGGRIIFFPNHENNVIAIINSKLTPSQAKLFRETCFGHFLDMNPIAMQTQLIHSALHREVHQKNPYEMWFKFGSQNFRFSLAEFAVVTGLLCVGDSDMSGYAKKENAFVDKYFSDQQVTVSAVEERFRYSDFKLDEYAVKMAVLYFVSNCLFTSPNSKKVPNEILNIVGIGDYESFPWGKLDLVMKEVDDVDLVTENVKDYSIDPVLNLAESGGVLVNEGDTVVEGEGLQNVGDGGLVKEGHTALLRYTLSNHRVTQNRSRRQIRNRFFDFDLLIIEFQVGEAYVSRIILKFSLKYINDSVTEFLLCELLDPTISYWVVRKLSTKLLDLNGCSNLTTLSEISGNVKFIRLSETAIKELHPSIFSLKNLLALDLQGCKHLRELPNSICELESLEYLNLGGCVSFDKFPRLPKSIKGLHLSGTLIQKDWIEAITLSSLHSGDSIDQSIESIFPDLNLPATFLEDYDKCRDEKEKDLIEAITLSYSLHSRDSFDESIESIILPYLNLPVTFLEDYYDKYRDEKEKDFRTRDTITQWFAHQSMGSSLQLNLPFSSPKDLRKYFLGFALCIVVEFEATTLKRDDVLTCKYNLKTKTGQNFQFYSIMQCQKATHFDDDDDDSNLDSSSNHQVFVGYLYRKDISMKRNNKTMWSPLAISPKYSASRQLTLIPIHQGVDDGFRVGCRPSWDASLLA
ncbi:hypothetical protein G4B88_007028 [Cannabis sativa]|uniref:DUF1985 domain-containing protein n=1 Tax=Cannabis sativa TaxID=3483 RepID=A0A7J6FNJ8_CANSA|nr:hypothetical protein G4B88_007028 [Cannabis sativa]